MTFTRWLEDKKKENQYYLSVTINTKQPREKAPTLKAHKPSRSLKGSTKAQKPSLQEDPETSVSVFPESKIFLRPARQSASNIYLVLYKRVLDHEDAELGFTSMSLLNAENK